MLLAELSGVGCTFGPVAADASLALYGAGNLGRLARDFLKAVGRDFAFVMDRNAQQRADDPDWAGVPLVEPEDVSESDKSRARVAVSIVTSPYVPIERALSRVGFSDVVPFYDLVESFRPVHPLSNGWFADSLTAEDREKTVQVLARWDDDISRAQP